RRHLNFGFFPALTFRPTGLESMARRFGVAQGVLMRARQLWVNILAWPAGWRVALPLALLLAATLNCALPGAGTAIATPTGTSGFVFIPQDAVHGVVTYAYSIPSAGETHDAKGTYTISPPRPDGTLTLSLSVSDHVVFRGFDGHIPLNYRFDLVPAPAAPCS